jgi:hypothetical protein
LASFGPARAEDASNPRLREGDIIALWARFLVAQDPLLCELPPKIRSIPRHWLIGLSRVRDGVLTDHLPQPVAATGRRLRQVESAIRHALQPDGPSYYCVKVELVESDSRMSVLLNALSPRTAKEIPPPPPLSKERPDLPPSAAEAPLKPRSAEALELLFLEKPDTIPREPEGPRELPPGDHWLPGEIHRMERNAIP